MARARLVDRRVTPLGNLCVGVPDCGMVVEVDTAGTTHVFMATP